MDSLSRPQKRGVGSFRVVGPSLRRCLRGNRGSGLRRPRRTPWFCSDVQHLSLFARQRTCSTRLHPSPSSEVRHTGLRLTPLPLPESLLLCLVRGPVVSSPEVRRRLTPPVTPADVCDSGRWTGRVLFDDYRHPADSGVLGLVGLFTVNLLRYTSGTHSVFTPKYRIRITP